MPKTWENYILTEHKLAKTEVELAKIQANHTKNGICTWRFLQSLEPGMAFIKWLVAVIANKICSTLSKNAIGNL